MWTTETVQLAFGLLLAFYYLGPVGGWTTSAVVQVVVWWLDDFCNGSSGRVVVGVVAGLVCAVVGIDMWRLDLCGGCS